MPQDEFDRGKDLEHATDERRHDYTALIDAVTAVQLRLAMLDDRLAKQAHTCRFSEDEARAMHQFAQTISNGGWEKFTAILDFGTTLITVRKAGTVALVGLVIAALFTAIIAGIKQQMKTPAASVQQKEAKP